MHCGSCPTQSPVTQDGTTEITQWTRAWPTLRNWLIWPHLTEEEFKNRKPTTDSGNNETEGSPLSHLLPFTEIQTTHLGCVSPQGPSWGLQVSTLLGQHSCQNLSRGFPGGSVVKNPPANTRDAGLVPGFGKIPPPEKEMATHSSIHA